jgi:hypothetical protein
MAGRDGKCQFCMGSPGKESPTCQHGRQGPHTQGKGSCPGPANCKHCGGTGSVGNGRGG